MKTKMKKAMTKTAKTQESIIHDFRLGSHQIVKDRLKEQYAEALREHHSKQFAEKSVKKKFQEEMKKSAIDVGIMDRVVF